MLRNIFGKKFKKAHGPKRLLVTFAGFFKNLMKSLTGLKFLTMAVISIAIAIIVGFNSYRMLNSPDTCNLCHEMKPEYVTWRASVHNNFVCSDCHMAKGISGTVKTASLRLYEHLTGTYKQPIEVKAKSSNEICLGCHSAARIVTPPSDLEFPHKKHVAKGFDCIECHTGAAHGNILEKGYTTLTDYSKWTIGMGRAYMQEKFTITPMDKCMDCHEDNKVSNDCATCHTGIGIPEDHQADNWKQMHGQKAKENIWQCDKCHSYTNNWMRFSEAKTDYGDYARNNKFCSKCHVGMEGVPKDFPVKSKSKNQSSGKRGSKATNYKPLVPAPPSHNDTWRQTHGQQASTDKEGCLVCHDETKNAKANSTTTYCVKCHKGTHRPSKNHPINLQGQKFNASCFRCHPQSSCNKCHAVK